MSLAIIRTEIKSILDAISSIGQVHEYERFTHEWKQYQKLFTKNDKVNVWQIERPEVRRWVEATQGPTGGVERVVHSFVLRGFYGINDEQATDKTFQDIVEEVCQAFRGVPQLALVTPPAEMVYESREAPVMATIYKDMLGQVLCHVAEVNIAVQEKVTFTV